MRVHCGIILESAEALASGRVDPSYASQIVHPLPLPLPGGSAQGGNPPAEIPETCTYACMSNIASGKVGIEELKVSTPSWVRHSTCLF